MAGAIVTLAVVTILAAIGVGSWTQSISRYPLREKKTPGCFLALFSFGSSVADTGTQATVWPFDRSEQPPYGNTFFGKPSMRYSDGRLHIDFWASALQVPFLDPYLKSVRADFRRGANFAAAGATASNFTDFSPFSLSKQLSQFQKFKRDVLSLTTNDLGSGMSPFTANFANLSEESFREGLYIIAIGGNDFTKWLLVDNLTFEEVEVQVPQSSASILRVVEALYDEGARNILIENVHPEGCMPFMLSKLAQKYSNHLDSAGCINPINDLVKLHNTLLKERIEELGKRLQDASISVIDTFSKRYEVTANYKKYGFQVPLKACCGAGGDYNYRTDIPCGVSLDVDGQLITAAACENVSSHIIWDGVHYTDAFNHVVMKSILGGNYFYPPFNLLRNDCSLAPI